MIRHLLATAALLCASTFAFAGDPQLPAEGATNPPPKVRLDTYQRFELAPVAMGAPYAGQKGNEVAKEKLQANLEERVGAVLREWNAKDGGAAPRTLRIEPEIRHIRFITGGKRFFAGGFAGDSSVMVRATLVDAATGEVVGQPDFYQHANAMGAAWSFGATDKTMLIRLASMLREYLRANYDKATPVPVGVAPEVDD